MSRHLFHYLLYLKQHIEQKNVDGTKKKKKKRAARKRRGKSFIKQHPSVKERRSRAPWTHHELLCARGFLFKCSSTAATPCQTHDAPVHTKQMCGILFHSRGIIINMFVYKVAVSKRRAVSRIDAILSGGCVSVCAEATSYSTGSWVSDRAFTERTGLLLLIDVFVLYDGKISYIWN